MLLNFGEDLERRPIQAEDLPKPAEPAEQLRRVKRRKGRRNLANFENLPVTKHIYELSEAERACPCCGLTRKAMLCRRKDEPFKQLLARLDTAIAKATIHKVYVDEVNTPQG